MIDAFLWAVAFFLLIPLTVLIVETFAALMQGGRRAATPKVRPPCAVLIPAHDEEAGIARTIASIRGQLEPEDRLIVVADNCSDGTAAAAQSAGATVVERHDLDRRGKGYALDHGVRFLEATPPEVVVVIDADCLVEPGAIDALVRQAAGGRPAQAVYVMHPAPGDPVAALSAFAVQFKNSVRPRGLWQLGLPCLLTGAGMAFPWPQLRTAALANGNIVEDMQLGIDLAVAGHAPELCPDATVRAELPVGGRAALTQRTRWEHGHLQTLLNQVPRLLLHAAARARIDLALLALELSVPPLSLLGAMWAVGLLVTTLAAMLGASVGPAFALAVVGGLAVAAVVAAWRRFGRDHLPGWMLLAAPYYLLRKLPVYFSFLVRPQQTWVRTERTPTPPVAASPPPPPVVDGAAPTPPAAP